MRSARCIWKRLVCMEDVTSLVVMIKQKLYPSPHPPQLENPSYTTGYASCFINTTFSPCASLNYMPKPQELSHAWMRYMHVHVHVHVWMSTGSSLYCLEDIKRGFILTCGFWDWILINCSYTIGSANCFINISVLYQCFFELCPSPKYCLMHEWDTWWMSIGNSLYCLEDIKSIFILTLFWDWILIYVNWLLGRQTVCEQAFEGSSGLFSLRN